MTYQRLNMWIYGSVVFLCYLTVQGEEECDPGKYGDACSQNCSQKCKPLPSNIVLCHKETGECFEGCKGGVYGNLCNEPCSKNCQGDICNQQNGRCTLGCTENHIGDFCETSQEINTVHQGTTYSSSTTVTTGVVPTSSSQVIIPVVVVVLILILVGAVVIFIWRRKKEKKKKNENGDDAEAGQSCLGDKTRYVQNSTITAPDVFVHRPSQDSRNIAECGGSPPCGQDKQDLALMEANLMKEIQKMKDGQDKQDLALMEANLMKEIQKMKDMMMSMQKMMFGCPPPSESSGISPVSETQIECGSQDDSAWSEGSSLESDVQATNGEGDTPMSETTSRPDTRATPTPAGRDARADDDLHVACRKGKLAEVKRILDKGRADVNCRGVAGMTPVMWPAWWGHRDVVEFLVSQGADVSLVDDGGSNILCWACLGGDRKTVEFVLSLDGVDINSRGWRSRTRVMTAATRGPRDVVELIVSEGADVSLVDDDGDNILHWACLGGDRETVEFVLSLDGVDINFRNNDGKTAADVARDVGHRQLSDFLMSRGTQ